MRVSFELEPSDIERFHEALDRAARIVRDTDEVDIVAATKHSLDNLPIGGAPGYVRKRMTEVHRLVLMLEDEAWQLPQPERDDVLRTLVYFSDPEDLVPETVANLTFGGFGKSRMFICATSSLYAIETARTGAQWP